MTLAPSKSYTSTTVKTDFYSSPRPSTADMDRLFGNAVAAWSLATLCSTQRLFGTLTGVKGADLAGRFVDLLLIGTSSNSEEEDSMSSYGCISLTCINLRSGS